MEILQAIPTKSARKAGSVLSGAQNHYFWRGAPGGARWTDGQSSPDGFFTFEVKRNENIPITSLY